MSGLDEIRQHLVDPYICLRKWPEFTADVERLLAIAEAARDLCSTYEWRLQKYQATYAQHLALYDALRSMGADPFTRP